MTDDTNDDDPGEDHDATRGQTWLTYRYRLGGDARAEASGTIKAPSFLAAARRLVARRLFDRLAGGTAYLRLRAAGEDEQLFRVTIAGDAAPRVERVPADAWRFAAHGRTDPASPTLLRRIDHLVYATPDVDATVEALAERTGVRATPGGPHPGRGTRNALLALDAGPGAAAYLEIVGPDRAQPAPERPRWFRVDALDAPRLVAWAANATDLDRAAAAARAAGVPLGDVRTGSRRRPDGALLAWRFTDPEVVVAEGVVPFLIDWGDSPHPSAAAAPGLSLRAFRASHPDPEVVRAALAALALDLPIDGGPRAALVATLDTPHGPITLE